MTADFGVSGYCRRQKLLQQRHSDQVGSHRPLQLRRSRYDRASIGIRSVKQPGDIVSFCLPSLNVLSKPIVDNAAVFAVVDKRGQEPNKLRL